MSANDAAQPKVLLVEKEAPAVLDLESRMDAPAPPPLLRTLLDSLSDAVIAVDAAGCVSYLNGAAETLTGWPRGEALGHSVEEVYPIRTLSGEAVDSCPLRRALAHAASTAKERFRLRRRSGAEVAVEDAASPLREDGQQDGQVVGAVAVICDISERVAAEQQQERHRRRQKELVRNATTALGETRAELQALSRHLMSAQEEERSRLARELHDDLGQQTALLELELDRLQLLLPPTSAEARRVVASLRARSRQIETGLRGVSHRLHPAALEDLGLVQALRMLVDEHCRCGRDICLVGPAQELPLLPKQTKTALYRIAQEALRNAYKHAPFAPVRLVLSTSMAPTRPPGVLYLSIEDAGPGFDLQRMRAGGGLGLLSMQERAQAVGGSLEIDTSPGEGTRIEVLVPLSCEVEHALAGSERWNKPPCPPRD